MTGEFYSGGVDIRESIFESIALQSASIGTVGVGFEELRPGFDVFTVDRPDQTRMFQVQFVEVGVQSHAAGVEFGPHGPVTDQDALFQSIQEIGLQEFLWAFRYCDVLKHDGPLPWLTTVRE